MKLNVKRLFILGLGLLAVCEGLPRRCSLSYPLKCPAVCTLDYHPVCGSDGHHEPRTFANCCNMASHACSSPDNEEWHAIKLDACESSVGSRYVRSADPACDVDCPPDYNPVCGKSIGRGEITFLNECFVKSSNCDTEDDNDKYRVVRSGRC